MLEHSGFDINNKYVGLLRSFRNRLQRRHFGTVCELQSGPPLPFRCVCVCASVLDVTDGSGACEGDPAGDTPQRSGRSHSFEAGPSKILQIGAFSGIIRLLRREILQLQVLRASPSHPSQTLAMGHRCVQ